MPPISSTVASTGKGPLRLDLPIIPTSGAARRDAAISTSDVETLEALVRDMEGTLASDFANGRVGMRYNTYAHRSRVLRQQKARLDVLRASVQSQEQ